MTTKILTVSDYREIRQRGIELHGRIVNKLLNKDDLKACARHLGVWHQKMLMIDSDIEMDLFMDYAIYDYRPHGFNLAEKYYRLFKNKEDDFEQAMLERMRFAHYSVFRIEESNRKDTLKVVDLFDHAHYKLVDINLSKSARKGMILAGNLIDFDGFSIQSGAAVQFLKVVEESEEVTRVLGGLDDRERAAFLSEPANVSKLARAVVAAVIRLKIAANVNSR